MINLRTSVLACLVLAMTALTGNSPALAAHTYLDSRNSGSYTVTPAMMHAIDMIVAARMKMMHHRR